jgi:DNA-binding NarL/FixJ family response regulator
MVKRTSLTPVSRGNISHQACAISSSTVSETASPRACAEHAPSRLTPSDDGCIVLIERRALIRDCLRRCLALSCGVNVIAVRNADEWLELSKTTPVSLVILSTIGASNGADVQHDMARLVQAKGAHPMVVISDGDDLEQIVGTLDNGAQGYIPTDLTLDIAIEAMRLVRAGGIFVPASSLVAARRTGEAGGAAPRSPNSIFTARQAAVVDALRRGKANKVIAYELKMRESTVKVHVRNIMKKLNAKNRTEVAFLANELIKAGSPPPAAYIAR